MSRKKKQKQEEFEEELPESSSIQNWGSEPIKQQLAVIVLREQFGDIVAKVAGEILLRKDQRLGLIMKNTNLSIEDVRKSLMVLIQHNCATYRQNEIEANKMKFCTYTGILNNILQRVRFPTYIALAKDRFEDGDLLLEEFLANGKLTLDEAARQATAVYTRLLGAHGATEAAHYERLSGNVQKMAQAGYLERVEALELVSTVNEANNSKNSLDLEIQTDTSRAYWRVNYHKFNMLSLYEGCLNYIREKYENNLDEIMKVAFQITEVIQRGEDLVSRPFSIDQIMETINSNSNTDVNFTDLEILSLLDGLSKGPNAFVTRVAGTEVATYYLNVGEMFRCIKQRMIESIVHEKFGPECARMFRLLIARRFLEQKQIQQFAMIPPKDTRELLHKMLTANYVHIQEISKSNDRIPNRTIYLFTIKMDQLCHQINSEMYKTMFNLKVRLLHHLTQSHELIAKAQTSHQRPQEITLTNSEKQALQRIQHIEDLLENTILKIDESLLIVQSI